MMPRFNSENADFTVLVYTSPTYVLGYICIALRVAVRSEVGSKRRRTFMNRTRCFLFFLLVSNFAFAQSPSAPPDPYKPVLDRLQSISAIPLATWQTHATDLPHGEDPALATSDWQPVKLKEDWKGSRWLRLAFEVPAQLNGYSLQGARISLDLHVSSNDAIQLSVFSNGNMVARTDEDGQVPITLIENAQPGQRLVLAVRVLDSGGGGCCGGNSTRIEHAELSIQPPPNRRQP